MRVSARTLSLSVPEATRSEVKDIMSNEQSENAPKFERVIKRTMTYKMIQVDREPQDEPAKWEPFITIDEYAEAIANEMLKELVVQHFKKIKAFEDIAELVKDWKNFDAVKALRGFAKERLFLGTPESTLSILKDLDNSIKGWKIEAEELKSEEVPVK